MSMHLLPAYWTTTRTSKKKKPNARVQKAQEEHDKWLIKRGLHPSQRSVAQPGSASGLGPEGREFKSLRSDQIPLSNKIPTGVAPKPEKKLYTGTEIIGIATMHKSNMVPIRNKKSAEEVAKMRRG